MIIEAAAFTGLLATDTGKTIVEKISAGMGVLYEPTRIVKEAQAKSKASLIEAEMESKIKILEAETKLQILDTTKRAMLRMIHEETREQINMERIATNSLQLIDFESAKPESIDSDWMTLFFKNCRIVSDQEISNMWSKILAGQIMKPNSFSRKTLNLMQDIGHEDAKCFQKICSYIVKIDGRKIPLFTHFNPIPPFYEYEFFSYGSLKHLEDLGLVNTTYLGLICEENLQIGNRIEYFNKSTVIGANPPQQTLTGHLAFTKAGIEISQICEGNPVDGFFDHVVDYFQKNGVVLHPVS